MTTSKGDPREPFVIADQVILPGERRQLHLPTALLPTHTPLSLPLTVVHARRPGPVLWVSAAVHGDELNGIEIIRQVLDLVPAALGRGTLLAVPIVNVFGFIGHSRYLPDRRDLNRAFPGSLRGSLASRMAHLFMHEIVDKCTHGLDLHTAARDRSNLPQVRGNLADEETLRLAKAFGAPAMVQSIVRDGSLRAAATRRGIPNLVFEGGEPLRFNPGAIAVGVRGVLSVLQHLGMIPRRTRRPHPPSRFIGETTWARARMGGILRLAVRDGDVVGAKDQIAVITDPMGEGIEPLRAPYDALVLGTTLNPVVHGGDAVVHLGRLDAPRRAEPSVADDPPPFLGGSAR